jgi:predicted esterase
MPPSKNSSALHKQPLKILMLHGFTQSGPSFHVKTRALEKNLQKAFPSIKLHYPTAPIRLPKADLPTSDQTKSESEDAANGTEDASDAWGWWRRKDEAESFTYEGIELGLARIAEVLKSEGPFDGVIGFSQGGCATGMVASLLEPGRREAFEAAQAKGGMRFPESFENDTNSIEGLIHPPLKFAVSYSGFAPSTNPLYQGFYEPQIHTPMLHFLGSVDTVVEEKRSLWLVDACVDGRKEGRLVYHPGGHFLPSSQRQYVSALISFIKEITEGETGASDERLEDLDVPF